MVGYFPALSETFVLNQITGLIDRGHKVDIYASSPRRESAVHPDVDNYQLLQRCHYRHVPDSKLIRYLKMLVLFLMYFHKNPRALIQSLNVFKYSREALSLQLFYSVISIIKSGVKDYDFIYCHFGPYGNLGVFLREIGAIRGKVVTTFHGYDITSYLKERGSGVYSTLFEKGDLFLPISQRWKERLVALGCPEDKIVIHRMGINASHFPFVKNTVSQGEVVNLVTIARLVEKKGVEYGIRAVAQLVVRHYRIRLTIVGDGPLRQELQKLIADLNMEEHIFLVGPKTQGEIFELLKEADLFMAPSITASNGDQEGIPVVLMEAMAIGLPILSTWHSGIPELVRDGVNGYLVPEKNVLLLAHKMKELIDNRWTWGNMSRAGRQIVEEHYDIHRLNHKLENILMMAAEIKETENEAKMLLKSGA